MKLTTDRHEASCGLFATVELLSYLLAEDEVLMGVKTLIKISVRDLYFVDLCSEGEHCVVDHNPNTSQ